MSFSLNEVDATAKKAARGVGYSWGMAEEAGKAVRWLCSQGVDGCAVLAELLSAMDGQELSRHAPDRLTENWQSNDDLCPLLSGACLSDCASMLSTHPITMNDVIHPALILPFAARVARRSGQPVVVDFGTVHAATDGAGLAVSGDLPKHSDQITVRLGDMDGAANAKVTRGTPTAEIWASLNVFAHRTYAPATEESRLLGAGAGLSDND